MSLPETVRLNNGVDIPTVLYGSYKSTGDEGSEAMIHALDKAGYRGIDTALVYGNHADVRKAIHETKVPRKDFIVQTKLWPTQMRDPAKWLDQCVNELGTYIDIFMIHWPIPLKGPQEIDDEWDFVETWKLMEKLPKDKVRAIGVSNFTRQQLERLLKETTTVPVVNQCEFHPQLPQPELVEYCLKHNIVPQAYRPLLHGETSNPTVEAIAKKHNVDPGQVLLSWNVQRGVVVLPKSSTPSRIESNHRLVKLDDDDFKQIAELGKAHNRTCTPLKFYGFDYFKEQNE